MWKKTVKPGETVPLKLTAAERRQILEESKYLSDDIQVRIQDAGPRQAIMLTLEELDDLIEVVAGAVDHCEDPKRKKKRDALALKIEGFAERFTEADDDAISPEEAGSKLAKAMQETLAGKNPGVVSFQLKRSPEQRDKKYPIKLTPLQREALICATQIKAAINRRLREAGDGPQVLTFSEKELGHMHDELGQASVFAPSPYKQRIVAVYKKVFDLLEEVQLEAYGIKQPKQRSRPSTQSDLAFQFKVTLLDIMPPIWRRIQIPDGSLGDLHAHIQAAFGWWNYHMHQFEIDGERYGAPPPDDFDFGLEMIDETEITLSQLLPKSGKRTRWIYEYDFGDGWRHEVMFEGYPPIDKQTKLPLCVEGERACPPEDSGGPWGFAEYLEAIGDPKHEQHKEYMEWRGPFDASAFDAKKATKEMRKVRR